MDKLSKIEKAKKDLEKAKLQMELEEKLINALPENLPEPSNITIHSYQADGGLYFNAPRYGDDSQPWTKERVEQELLPLLPSISSTLCKSRTTCIFASERIKDKSREQVEIEPIYFKVEKNFMGNSPAPKLSMIWFTKVNDVLFHVKVELSNHNIRYLANHLRDWKGKRIIQYRWELDLPDDLLSAHQIKWWSSGKEPNPFTLYWEKEEV